MALLVRSVVAVVFALLWLTSAPIKGVYTERIEANCITTTSSKVYVSPLWFKFFPPDCLASANLNSSCEVLTLVVKMDFSTPLAIASAIRQEPQGALCKPRCYIICGVPPQQRAILFHHCTHRHPLGKLCTRHGSANTN